MRERYMATDQNPFLSMSAEERARQKKLLEYALAFDDAALDVAAVAALKWGYARLKSRDKLGEIFANINQQALPREATVGKAADLSETQIEAIKKAAVEALEKGLEKGLATLSTLPAK
jgi:hypothetical protein